LFLFFDGNFYKWCGSFVSMRKIRSRVDVARSKRNNNVLIGVIMVLLLVVAPIGYSLFSRDGGGSENKVSEMGFDFIRDGGYWKVVVGGEIFGFQYLPSEVADVFVNGSYDFGMYVDKPLYIVGVNNGASEILGNLGGYVLRYQEACVSEGVLSNETNCGGDLPVKDCGSNLIVFESGNETMVWQNESCVYIVGDGVRGADAFLYKTLKIG
jgi:hypothetical protein